MQEAVQVGVLGLGAGACYVLLTQGIILVYRSSGVVNFAHAAIALVGGFFFYELHSTSHWAWGPAVIATVALTAVLGALVFQLAIRPLRRASPLARVISTLGVLTILNAIATLRYSSNFYDISGAIPTNPLHIDGVIVPEDRIWLTGIAIAVTAGVWAMSRFTRVGLATTAVAENERSAAAAGWAPNLVATVNWALGGAMAGFAAVLIIPITGIDVQTMTFLIIPALAVALFAGFASFPLVLAGGLVLGVAQSELTTYVTNIQGAPEALPFVVIVAILVVRGTSLPLRGHLFDRLPAVGSGTFKFRVVIPLVLVAAAIIAIVPADWQSAIGTSLIAAIILLSVVVLTGYAGQLSLGQYAMGGIAALVSAQLVLIHVPFIVSLFAGVTAAFILGGVFGLPAVRARGITLAIVTLELGYAVLWVVFDNANWTGAAGGLNVGAQNIFGISIDSIFKPGNYAVFCLLCFAVCAWMVTNLRRGRTGRRLLAVRTNERAAAALGINVVAAKLYAFSISSAIAGVGGILVAYQAYFILFSQAFDPLNSISAITIGVLGGVGYASGPLFGSTLAQGGFPGGLITTAVNVNSQYLILLGGVVVILVLILNPDGMAKENARLGRLIASRLPRRRKATTSTIAAELPAPSPRDRTARGGTLSVRDLTVRFGGVVALDKVNLEIKPGEVLGLIGPNGAGKTTLIDAVTGFVKPSGGTIELDGVAIDGTAAFRRARAGLSRSFQSLELFDDISVLDNLRAASDTRDVAAYLTDLFHPTVRPLPSDAVAAVHEFELTEELDWKPNELPYGKRRLVAIARAVAAEPSVLLLDEPAAGLSDSETRELGRLVRRLADEWGLAILLIEHDVQIVLNTCDRIVVLDFGHKIADGTPDEIRVNPVVRKAYLGEDEQPAPLLESVGGPSTAEEPS